MNTQSARRRGQIALRAGPLKAVLAYLGDRSSSVRRYALPIY
jgi:hypothetical protein